MEFVVEWSPYYFSTVSWIANMRRFLFRSERYCRLFMRSQTGKIRWIFFILFDNSFFSRVFIFRFFFFLDGPLLLITWLVWNVALPWRIVSVLCCVMYASCAWHGGARMRHAKRAGASIWKEYERWKLNNKSFEWWARCKKKIFSGSPFLKFSFLQPLYSFLSRSLACDAIVFTDSYSSGLSVTLSATIFRHSGST